MKRYIKNAISLFMAFIMLVTVSAGVDFSAAAAVYGEDIISYARNYIGYPYVYGTQGPDSFDCSGFVQYVFRHFGISLPASSSYYWNNPTNYGTVIARNSIEDAQAGDVISWNGHVAVYTENGYIIEAANSRVGVAERKYDLIKFNGNYQVIRIYGVQSASYIDGLAFRDLGRYTAYIDYVRYTSQYNSYITGTNPPYYTEFSPDTSLTRAMLITILYRMAGSPYDRQNPYSENPFYDVPDYAYYYKPACWALKNGITTETEFKPYDNVSREQTAAFLFRYARDNGSVKNQDYKNVALDEKYSDFEKIREWAEEPLQWANYTGMITGTQQGEVNPQGETYRIHASKILYGFGKTCGIGNFK